MAKAIHLIAWFMLGCIAHSFAIWLGGLHPVLLNVVICCYVIIALMWLAAWVADDAIVQVLGVNHMILYGSLLGFSITLLIGASLTWMLQSNPQPY